MTGRAVRAGLLAGMAVVYVALVGMITTFNGIDLVGDKMPLGRMLILLPPIVAGFLVVRPRIVGGGVERPAAAPALAAGAVTGAVAAVLPVLGILLVDALPEGAARGIFTSVTPILLSILRFELSSGPGLAVLIGSTILGGVLGAAVGVLPLDARRPLEVGAVVLLLMSMLQNLFRVMLQQLGFETRWLYSTRTGGLTYLGAVVVFVVAAALTWLWRTRGARLRQHVQEMPPEGRRGLFGAGAMVLVLILAILPLLLGSFLSLVLGRIGIFLLMGLGLNIVVGYAGLLDLGYVAFFAVGAYATAVLTAAPNSGTSYHVGLSFPEALPIVIVLAVATGLLIGAPVLRLRGDYLALVTLGFGEIARKLVTSDWLKPLLGGASGLIGVPAPSVGGATFRDPQPFYYLTLVFCAVAIYISWRLSDSRVGRAWSAMREDEQVAEAMGISTVKYKLLAFATGAAFGSISGALFAVQIGSLSPASFTILVSITALAIVILGGMGSIPGVIVGAAVLIGLPGFLSEFEQYQLLIYGAVLMGIMILRPQGLIPNVRRSRELHEEEREQDAWLKRTGDASVDATIAVGAAPETATETTP